MRKGKNSKTLEIIWTKFSHIKNSILTQEYGEENTNKNQDKRQFETCKDKITNACNDVMMGVIKFESTMKTRHKS